MPFIRQIRIQSPEHFHDTQRCLGYRLRCIAARRGHCADYRKGSFPSFFSERNHMSRSLIKLGKPASQISRIAFLSRHLFQTAGHLPERLGPPGCGVCHERHRVAHIPEILRNGDPCIDRSLPGGHRHIGCIGNQNRPLHQGLSRLRILQLRELIQHVCHLIAPLTAADINYNIRFRPFCKLMLNYCLAASEGARHRRHAAFGKREESINHPLSGYKRHFGRQLFPIGPSLTYRPFLHHSQFPVTLLFRNNSDRLLHRKRPCSDFFYRSADTVRNHNFLLHKNRLLYRSDYISGLHLIAGFYSRNKFPLPVSFQGRNFHASLQVISRYFHNVVQRPLYAIVDACNQSRPQFHRHGYAHGLYRFSRSQAGSFLIDLD